MMLQRVVFTLTDAAVYCVFSRYESTFGTMELYTHKLLSSDTDANICREKLQIDSFLN